jgi:hypothetical protein
MYMVTVFNSRMNFNNILDTEDYWQCNPDFVKFVVNQPTEKTYLWTVYIFSVLNPKQTITIGYRPRLVETGPYGYISSSLKYDVSFDKDSKNVSYSEFSVLKQVDDVDTCERMYYRIGNVENPKIRNPCFDNPGSCKCIKHDKVVTIVNPLYLKLIYKESAVKIIATLSVDVFKTIKTALTTQFPEAVKSYMVMRSFQEVFLFRLLLAGIAMFPLVSLIFLSPP